MELGGMEAHRLQQYGKTIISDAYPLLLLLTDSAASESLPLEWIENVAAEFTALLALIDEAWLSAKEEYVESCFGRFILNLIDLRVFRSATSINTPQHIYTTRTGKRGQPKKHVDPKVLHDAFQKGRRIPTTVLASILGIDRKTLRARMQELDIDSSFDKISDDNLDNLVQQYHQENPGGGRAYIIGRLRAVHFLRIQRHRVIDSMNRIDRLGQGLRQHIGKKKERRRYHVARPNALWHIDGHHKLIAWGIVIHGVADGYSRKVYLVPVPYSILR